MPIVKVEGGLSKLVREILTYIQENLDGEVDDAQTLAKIRSAYKRAKHRGDLLHYCGCQDTYNLLYGIITVTTKHTKSTKTVR